MKSLELQLNEALATIEHYQRVVDALKTALHEEKLLHAQVQLEAKIAALPTDAKERLRRAFPGTHIAGLREAVNVEKRTKQNRRVEKILGGAR